MSSTMDRIIILLSLAVAIKSEDVGSCLDTVMFNRHCCNYEVSKENRDIMRDCFQGLHDPHSCNFDACYGKRKGFLMPNGTIDKIRLEESLEKDFENYTNIYDVVKVKCLNNDMSAYGQEDTCYLRELGNCIHFYILANCLKWIESEDCLKVKETIQECTNIFP